MSRELASIVLVAQVVWCTAGGARAASLSAPAVHAAARPVAATTDMRPAGIAGPVPVPKAAGSADSGPSPEAGSHPSALSPAEMGVAITGLHLSGAGYLLDLRFRVLEPERAAALMKMTAKPLLIDETTGKTLIVPSPPKVGSLRTTGLPQAGRTYFMIFGNPGRFLQRGARVTLVVGDMRASDLVVE